MAGAMTVMNSLATLNFYKNSRGVVSGKSMSLGLCLLGTLLVGRASQAGPLLDWLSPGRNEPYKAYSVPTTVPPATPVAYTAPPVPAYRGVAGPAVQAGYAPQPYYGAAAVPYLPPTGPYVAGYAPNTAPPVGLPTAAGPPTTPPPIAGSCGAGTCYETVMRYLPETSYRTVWAPVPVTQYTTTTSTNPNTGLPITCTRPCTTYSWQARREPYTSYRPVYQQVPLSADPAFTPAAAPAVAGPAPVKAFRPFGGLFSRDRTPPSYASGYVPATTLGGVLPPSANPYAPAPNAYGYAPPPAQPTPGCSSCGGGARLTAPAVPYEPSPSSIPTTSSPAPGGTAQPDGTYATPWRPSTGSVGTSPPNYGTSPTVPAPSSPNGLAPDLEAPRLDPNAEIRQMVPVSPQATTRPDFSPPSENPVDQAEPSSSFAPDINPSRSTNADTSSGPTGLPLQPLRDLHQAPSETSEVPPLLPESTGRGVDRTAQIQQREHEGQSVPITWVANQPERRDLRQAPHPSAVTGQIPPASRFNQAPAPRGPNRSAYPTSATRGTAASGWHAP